MLLAVLPTLIVQGQETTTEPAKPEKTKKAPDTDPYVLFPAVGVKLVCPTGFVRAEKFHGFMQRATAGSIMVARIPAPYSEIRRGFEPKTMLARGMRLNSKKPVKVDGVPGVLMSVSQRTPEAEFTKWMVVVGDEKRCVMLIATFPAALGDKLSAPLKKTILAAKLDESALASAQPKVGFSITPSKKLKPFRVVAAMGKALAYTIEGKAHPDESGSPSFIAAPDISERAIPDKRGFATKRMFQQTHRTKVSKIQWTKAISIDGLDGFESLANAQHGDPGQSLAIYQVILFTETSCFPAKDAEQWLPEFQAMARSFKRDKRRAAGAAGTSNK